MLTRMILTVLAAGMLSATAFLPEAEACSPPLPFFVLEHGTIDQPLITTKSHIAVGIQKNEALTLTAIVSPVDEPETTLPGTTVVRTIGRDILIWTADEPLVEGQYRMKISDERDDWREETVFEYAPREESEFSVGEPTIEMAEMQGGGTNCCDTSEGECIDSCGGNECRTCWSIRYEYHPQMEAPLQYDQGSYLMRVFSKTSAGEELQMTRMLTVEKDSPAIAFFPEEPAETYCMRVDVIDPADDMVVFDSGELCRSESDIPAYERRRLDNRMAISQCSSPPDDTSDPNWQRYDDGLLSCSAVAGNSVPAWPLLLLGLLALRRRRSR